MIVNTSLLRAAILSVLAIPTFACAALGEAPNRPANSAQARLFHAAPTILTPTGSSYTKQATTTIDGGTLVEYVNAQGMVFAVRWDAPTMPDMAALLGSYKIHLDQAQTEGRIKARSPRALNAQHGDWIIVSSGHLRAFSGYSLLKSIMPSQFDMKELAP